MPRKAKKRMHKMPPLSFRDQLIYWTVFLLLCAADLALLLGPMPWRRKIAFSDPTVIAWEENASMLWQFVPLLTFFLMTLILWTMAYRDRRPIFGRKHFKYGPPGWPRVYPLFMKNKPAVWVSERKKKQRKQIAVLLLSLLLVSFIPLPFSLYGRSCLCSNGDVVQYNMFNTQICTFTGEDIFHVEFETYSYNLSRRSFIKKYSVQMVVKTNRGKTYIFDYGDFRNEEAPETLSGMEAMLHIKECYNPGIIHYHGAEDLEYVIEDQALDPKETDALYQLFEP